MTEQPDVVEQLRTYIQDCGMNPREVAQRSGVAESQLSRFLRGQRDLNLATVAKLCRVLGLELIERAAGRE
jgi:transcriptional regulator with XRE-family HTH domain